MEPSNPEANVFSYRITKNGKVFIEWNRKTVRTLKGSEGERFLEKIASAPSAEGQMIMAKATGNFKRGNEKTNRNR